MRSAAVVDVLAGGMQGRGVGDAGGGGGFNNMLSHLGFPAVFSPLFLVTHVVDTTAEERRSLRFLAERRPV